MLPLVDMNYLASRYPDHAVQEDGGMICVVIRSWKVPPG